MPALAARVLHAQREGNLRDQFGFEVSCGRNGDIHRSANSC
jgi:hypothetical protein